MKRALREGRVVFITSSIKKKKRKKKKRVNSTGCQVRLLHQWSVFLYQVCAPGSVGKLRCAFSLCSDNKNKNLKDLKSGFFPPVSNVFISPLVFFLSASVSHRRSHLSGWKATPPPQGPAPYPPLPPSPPPPHPPLVYRPLIYSGSHTQKGERRGRLLSSVRGWESRLWCPPAPFSGSSLYRDKGAAQNTLLVLVVSLFRSQYGRQGIWMYSQLIKHFTNVWSSSFKCAFALQGSLICKIAKAQFDYLLKYATYY